MQKCKLPTNKTTFIVISRVLLLGFKNNNTQINKSKNQLKSTLTISLFTDNYPDHFF